MYLMMLNERINKSAWLLEDKQWVKERNQKWKKLASFLRKGPMRASDVKYYQTYYLTGVLPKPEDDFSHPQELNAVTFMMLHADQSEANLRSVYKHFIDVYSTGDCDDESIGFFNGLFSTHRDITSLTNGFKDIVNGQEELYIKILYGESETEFKLRHISKDSQLFIWLCSSMMLILDESVYENHLDQYLIDFFFLAVEKTDFKRRGRFQDDFPRFLQVIAYYELLDPFKNVNELRYQKAWKVVNHLRARFNDPELYPPLKERWEFANTKEGRLTTYKFNHEYPILEKLHEGMEKLPIVKKKIKRNLP